MPETAVTKQEPHCPKCGWRLVPPPKVEPELLKPAVAWIAVECAGCDWRGHAKFWTRQTDEPS